MSRLRLAHNFFSWFLDALFFLLASSFTSPRHPIFCLPHLIAFLLIFPIISHVLGQFLWNLIAHFLVISADTLFYFVFSYCISPWSCFFSSYGLSQLHSSLKLRTSPRTHLPRSLALPLPGWLTVPPCRHLVRASPPSLFTMYMLPSFHYLVLFFCPYPCSILTRPLPLLLFSRARKLISQGHFGTMTRVVPLAVCNAGRTK